MGYTTAAIQGIGWIGLLQVSIRVITFAKIILIAKILSPTDIGMFAIVTAVLSLAEVFTETGLQTFLIQKQKELSKIIGTVWFMVLLRGLILFFVIVLLSYPVSLFFNTPSLIGLIAVASLIPLAKSLENPYIITFQKHLRFGAEFTYRFTVVLVDLFASLIFVTMLQSTLGLVLGLVTSVSIGALLSWFLLKEKPRLSVDKKILHEITTFTKSLVPLNIANYLVNQCDAIFVGRFVGVANLGVYQVSQKFSSQPIIELSDIFGKVTFPIYTKIAHERRRLFAAYKKIVLSLTVLSISLGIFLFFFSHYLIAFLGSSWEGASTIYPILLFYGLIMALWGSTGSLLFSIGGQKLLARLAIIRLFITVPIIGTSVFFFGLLGAAWALLISIIIMQPITFYYLLNTFSSVRDKKIKRKSV